MTYVPLSSIKNFVQEFLQEQPPHTVMRQGKVQQVLANGTINLTLGASEIVIPQVAKVASYVPTEGDTCWVAQTGPDLLVLGKVGPHNIVSKDGDIISGELFLNSNNYREHLKMERPDHGSSPVVEISPSVDGDGSMRILIDGEIAAWISDGRLHVNGIVTDQMPWAVYHRNTDLSVSNNSHTLIAYGTRAGHEGTWDSPTTSAFTIPQDGWYRLSCNHMFEGTVTTDGYLQIAFIKNNTSVTASTSLWTNGYDRAGYSPASGLIVGTSFPIPLVQGDVIRTFAYQNTGSTIQLHGNNNRPDNGWIAFERVR